MKIKAKNNRYIRYGVQALGILLLITILISADFIFNLLSLDPRANFTVFLGGRTLTAAGWIIIFLFLGSSMFFERPFCNYLCIEGAKKSWKKKIKLHKLKDGWGGGRYS